MTLADGAAELNLAYYYTEYKDLQVSQFDGALGFNVTNAGEATVQGIEADGRWAVSDNVILTGSAAYLDVNYDKVKDIKLVRPTIHRDISGRVKTDFRRIDADEFTVATLLPVARFSKAPISKVYSDSRTML